MRLLALLAAALFLTAVHAQAQVYAPYDGYDEYDGYGYEDPYSPYPLLPTTSQNLAMGNLCQNVGSRRHDAREEPLSSLRANIRLSTRHHGASSSPTPSPSVVKANNGTEKREWCRNDCIPNGGRRPACGRRTQGFRQS